MRPGLAGRLSRALVACHPRRWRERYGEEMLVVLDQHHPTARTVVSLAASAVSARLDPAWRTGRLSLPRLRRAALISAAVAAPLALVLGPVGYRMWQDSYWHPAADEPLETAAFSPHTGIMVTAFGEAIDGVDMVWDVTDLSRPPATAPCWAARPAATPGTPGRCPDPPQPDACLPLPRRGHAGPGQDQPGHSRRAAAG